MPADPLLVLAAAGLEAAVGYPDRLHRRVPHPVVWAGTAISALERAWNRPAWSDVTRRLLGVVTVLLVAGAAALLGWLPGLLPAAATAAVVVVLGSVGLAQRSLHDHVLAVLHPLEAGDLVAARHAVGMIVGRDVAELDASGVAAAALESLAESFNDGVAAPLFWFVLAGLPGLFAFKAVNTADSLIGHKEPRWRAFGWAAARTDDALNLIPARLAGAVVALAGGGGWRTMLADARKHASPNAGWPEAAMAGALGVRLGGAATYDGVAHDRPVFGAGPSPTAADLRRGLRVYVRACSLLWGVLLLGALAWPR
ncbi:MAG: adenosylcobinamide-phosphate synthase CbiB [Pseudomonadota bacterium]